MHSMLCGATRVLVAVAEYSEPVLEHAEKIQAKKKADGNGNLSCQLPDSTNLQSDSCLQTPPRSGSNEAV